MHTRTIGVENTHDFDVQPVLTVVVEKQSFSTPLAFVITAPYADGIHIAPVGFLLRMHLRIAVNLGRGRLENRNPEAARQFQHVHGAEHIGPGSLNRVMLVVNGRRRTRQIENRIDFKADRSRDIMTDEFK